MYVKDLTRFLAHDHTVNLAPYLHDQNYLAHDDTDQIFAQVLR